MTELVRGKVESSAMAARILSGRGRPAQVERERKLLAVLGVRHRAATRAVAEREEARGAPGLGLERVVREDVVRAAAGMRDVIRAAAERALRPAVEQIEHERAVHADRRV